jgi:hypothetical protein
MLRTCITSPLNPLPDSQTNPVRSVRTQIEPESMSSENKTRLYLLRNHQVVFIKFGRHVIAVRNELPQ